MSESQSSTPKPKDTLLTANDSNSLPNTIKNQQERDTLLAFIRDNLVKDPSTPLNDTDILDEEFKTMPLEKLKAIAQNIQYYKDSKDRGYYGHGVYKALNYVVENFTVGQYTIRDGLTDEDLIDDLDNFIVSYTGYLPSILKIVSKIAVHVREKKVSDKEMGPQSRHEEPTPKSNPANQKQTST